MSLLVSIKAICFGRGIHFSNLKYVAVWFLNITPKKHGEWTYFLKVTSATKLFFNIDSKILESNDSYLTQTLLFGSTSFDSETNTLVLNATIDYILSTERFEEPLF